MPDLDYQRRPPPRPRDAEAERVELRDWLVPLVLIAASLALVMIFPPESAKASWGNEWQQWAWVAAGRTLAKAAAATVVAVILSVLFRLGLNVVGRDLLKLLAAYVAAGALMSLAWPFIYCVSIVVYCGAAFVLLTWLLDVDGGEAALLSLACFGVELAAWSLAVTHVSFFVVG